MTAIIIPGDLAGCRIIPMRVPEQFLWTVDDWRRAQFDLPSRAEAIRRLVELATKIKKKPDTNR
jgi:hypothetical protein